MLESKKQNNIRNFSIIAHIDHGKSTLADRFLELTGVLDKSQMQAQVLDQMDLERERGITIKMQPCAMEYEFKGQKYFLNLIDTPGHMDFSYEVERSLAAVEGCVLLVDVVAGIQAQTLANLRLAQAQGLAIIPVINKLDICPSAQQLEKVKQEVANLLASRRISNNILCVSAKTGKNVEKVLQAVVEKVSAPSPAAAGGRAGEPEPLQALIFDSFYDNYQGVVAFVRIFSGQVKKDNQVYFLNQKIEAKAREVGIFKPKLLPVSKLSAGEIGYIATGIKNPADVTNIKIGDTITKQGQGSTRDIPGTTLAPLPGYREVKPMVFANLFPGRSQTGRDQTGREQNFEILKTSLEKLRLNDTSLNLVPVSNPYLGRGLCVGFLGMLHLEITLERLKREYATQVIITSPSVVFKAKLRQDIKEVSIHSAGDLSDQAILEYVKEPWVDLSVISPAKYSSRIHQLVQQKRGEFVGSKSIDPNTLILQFQAPLCEIIEDFLDKLKGLTQGFASFSYEFDCYQQSDLIKLDFLIARELKPSLSKIVHRSKAQQEAREFLNKLKKYLPRKNFSQALQAVINGKIIARENIKALRKDVTAPLYGGDVTRKKKLLEKQKKGKKQLAKTGTTHIPEQVYVKLLRK